MEKFRRFLLRMTIFLLVLLCLTATLAVLKRTPVMEKIRNTEVYALAAGMKQELQKLYGELREHLQAGKEEEEDMIGGKRSGIINILLIGQDRRPGEESGRSDTMILCSFRPKDKTLTLTSFLRDLYVEIPGHGKNRINAAFRFGGKELLQKTLQQNFSIFVDGTVLVDFDQFAAVVDALGGITLELREDEAREINRIVGSSLEPGSQLLRGDMALTYSRIRKLDADGDFSRTDRQRKVLSAILRQVKQADMKDLKVLGKQLLPHLDTDIGYLTALRIGGKVLPMLKTMEVHSQQIPASGEYSGQMIDGMSVLVPNMEKSRQRLKDTLLP